uniref:MPL proto-oncogene, thrombopoietin receptor n=1 Tax=Erpetoichthys calabaricus TaxID=27687 RepID=A0A8C4S252_ERPCA
MLRVPGPPYVLSGLLLATLLDASVLQLDDVLLLADEENPKCFTRTTEDLTCFWEGSLNTSYDFYHQCDEYSVKKCILSEQSLGTHSTLHVCSFPKDDVFAYTEIEVTVQEAGADEPIYERTLSIDNVVLPPPPADVCVSEVNKPSQLQVTWRPPEGHMFQDSMMYEVRYISKDSRVSHNSTPLESFYYDLLDLVGGEVYVVQVRTKCNGDTYSGFWSAWSEAVTAVAPETSEQINLLCFTRDFNHITCNWTAMEDEGTSYGLFFQSRRGSWELCKHHALLHDGVQWSCTFENPDTRDITVKVSRSLVQKLQLKHTFWKEPFKVQHIVQTEPPSDLKGDVVDGKLHLTWRAPNVSFLDEMCYEIRYSMENDTGWKQITLEGPEAATQLDVRVRSLYYIQVRAKPDGPKHRGYWSEWSDVYIADFPSSFVTVLAICISLALVLSAAVGIATSGRLIRKIKEHLWPPVPNLSRVLEDFFTEMNKQCQLMQPFNEKFCEDILPSLIEIVSEKETKPSAAVPPDESSSSSLHVTDYDQLARSAGKAGIESTGRDYVVLDPACSIKSHQAIQEAMPCLAETRHASYLCKPPAQTQLRLLLDTSTPSYTHLSGGLPSSMEVFTPVSVLGISHTDICNHSYLAYANAEAKVLVELEISRKLNQYANLDRV